MEMDDLFDFPCMFPIKVFGRNDTAFRRAAWSIVTAHYRDLTQDQIAENLSRDGRYVSVTFTVEARDRRGLDALYRDLSASREVLMTL